MYLNAQPYQWVAPGTAPSTEVTYPSNNGVNNVGNTGYKPWLATEGPSPGNETCCAGDVAAYNLSQVREDLGVNMANRITYGTGAGEGIRATPYQLPDSGTQQTQHGPVSVSDPVVTSGLYRQPYDTLSGVPMVHVGVFTDPLTGEQFDAWENDFAPPDTDKNDTLAAPGRNRKLAALQGGWRDGAGRPMREEILDDGYHQQYDRSINAFGTYDPSYYIDVINANNRYNMDDTHPDADGPVYTDLPANMMGNQGVVTVRYMPYAAPTNRGNQFDDTFHSFGGPEGGRTDYEYTNIPFDRAESNRQNAGGGGNQGATGRYDGWDFAATQRSLSEVYTPTTGPGWYGAAQPVHGEFASPNRLGGLQVNNTFVSSQRTTEAQPMYGEVGLPNRITGLQEADTVVAVQPDRQASALMNQYTDKVVPYRNQVNTVTTGLSTQGAQGAATEREDMYESPVRKGGTQVVTSLAAMSGPWDAQPERAAFDTSVKKGGTQVVSSMAAMSGPWGASYAPLGLSTAADMTKREAEQGVQARFDGGFSGTQAAAEHALVTRFSDKSGKQAGFVTPSGSLAGVHGVVAAGLNLRGKGTTLAYRGTTSSDASHGFQYPTESWSMSAYQRGTRSSPHEGTWSLGGVALGGAVPYFRTDDLPGR